MTKCEVHPVNCGCHSFTTLTSSLPDFFFAKKLLLVFVCLLLYTGAIILYKLALHYFIFIFLCIIECLHNIAFFYFSHPYLTIDFMRYWIDITYINKANIGESFWQKDSLITNILFELYLFCSTTILIFSPVANFGDQSLCKHSIMHKNMKMKLYNANL